MSKKQGNYKVVLLGDTSVGKSCLANRFVNDSFFDFQEPTIGAAFMTRHLEVGNYNIRYEIWDTAGQERYRSLAPMYYRGAMAAVIVYDITQEDSFKGAKMWINEIKTKGRKNCVIVLVGNKSDLDDKRKVNKQNVYEYVHNQNILYFEASAKSGDNVERIFYIIGEKLPKDIQYHSTNIKIDPPVIRIKQSDYICC